jgi:hypothetical protein
MLLAHVNSPNLQLRGAATDCLVEVVSKRMEPTAKVQLVQELRIAPAIAAWTASVAAAAATVSGGRPGALAALSAASSSSGGQGVHVPPEQAAAAAAMLEDEEILGKYATLLATTAGEVMDALKRIENSEWPLVQAGSGFPQTDKLDLATQVVGTCSGSAIMWRNRHSMESWA